MRPEGVSKALRCFEEVTPSESILPANVAEAAEREVFVVHGHDVAAREAVARFLMQLDLKPIILAEEVSAGKTIIE